MRIVLFGEGNTDVTTVGEGHRGALAILFSRIVQVEAGECEIIGRRLPRLQKGSGYPRKVDLAIAQAHIAGSAAVAIVVDRDGHRERLNMLVEGRNRAQANTGKPHAGLAWRTALGVAIEMLEAWLIADTAALNAIAEVKGALPDPESLADPKQHINVLLDQAGVNAAEAYDAIAQAVDLAEIERRCPAFRQFAQEVRTVILQKGQ